MPMARVCGSAEGQDHVPHVPDGDSLKSRVGHFLMWVFHSVAYSQPQALLLLMYHLLQVHGHQIVVILGWGSLFVC